LKISIIIIGKNSEKTLKSSIKSIFSAIENTNIINKFEIIYVDSFSSDSSIDIAQKFQIKIISITNGFTSASLGRYLGKKYSQYENLIFIDSDMYLDENWFNDSLEYYKKYGAIIGERYEKMYKNNKVIKEIPKFYNIEKVKEAFSIGGFLMIRKEIVENINYTPSIKNEEEKDFYAKFYDKNRIYKIPVLAYIHNNYNLTQSRIKDYISPYTKNGYILSLFNSIKNNYFKSYIVLQRKYIISVSSSLLFYMSIFTTSYVWLFISLVLLPINGKKNIRGSLMTMLFFPYKFIMSLIFLNKNKVTKYIYKNNKYEVEIKI
jgi:glycosyltransferase involved in cell wall biosynthesis